MRGYLFLKSIRTLLFSLTGCLFALSAAAQSYVPGEVIVKLKDSVDSNQSYGFVGKAHSKNGMQLKHSWSGLRMYHFKGKPNQKVEDLMATLKNDPDVEYVEPNYIYSKASSGGIDQTFSSEEITSVHTAGTYMGSGTDVGIPEFWQSASVSSQAATRPIIAVIDTGLDLNHPVFVQTNAVWTNAGEVAGNGIDDDQNGYIDDVHGYNFVDDSGVIYDDDGHGTHVSGIILSVDQDIYSGTYQTSRVQIMPLKFLDGNGSGSTSDAIAAIYYALENGAVVLNNSWGGPGYSAALHEAVAASYQAGASFVAAAGNSGTNNDSSPMYPANYDVPNLMAIAATYNDTLASFSNFGKSTVHLGSPGYRVLSTIPGGGFGQSSGTSMAAPLVAGTAIQMKVESPAMLGYQVKSIVFAQTQLLSSLSGKVYTDGRVQVNNSIQYAKTASVDSTQPSYQMSFAQDRELASALASGGGGCGMVSKLYSQYGQGPGGGGAVPESWYILLVVGLLVAPMLVATWLRSRSPENRRRYDRFKINSDVRIQLGERELFGSISTISLGGVQLNTEALLEDGGLVTMSISSPTGEEQIQVEGRVVWSEVNKAYGVAFQDATFGALDRISNWTKKLQKAS